MTTALIVAVIALAVALVALIIALQVLLRRPPRTPTKVIETETDDDLPEYMRARNAYRKKGA